MMLCFLTYVSAFSTDFETLTVVFQMPLDHFGTTAGTFKNRYWVNASYYEPGGPVFSE